MDMIIISVSYIVAFALRFTFRIENIDFQLLPFIYFLIIRLLVHLVFKAYTGIIRHTSIEDVVILFKTVATGSLIIKLFELVVIRKIYGETPFHILTQILLIDFVICLYFLIGSRFLVKFIARHNFLCRQKMPERCSTFHIENNFNVIQSLCNKVYYTPIVPTLVYIGIA